MITYRQQRKDWKAEWKEEKRKKNHGEYGQAALSICRSLRRMPLCFLRSPPARQIERAADDQGHEPEDLRQDRGMTDAPD